MKRSIYSIGAVISLIALGVGVWMYMDRGPESNVPIADRFDEKIVYTTDLSADVEALQAHCKAQGGLFNECGSACPTYADMCTSVCAYTCEDL